MNRLSLVAQDSFLTQRALLSQLIRMNFSFEDNAIFATRSLARKRTLRAKKQDPLRRRTISAPTRVATRNEAEVPCSQ